jgi:hypothetical protein
MTPLTTRSYRVYSHEALQLFLTLNYFTRGLSCGDACLLRLAFRPLRRAELQRVKTFASILASPTR